MSEAATEPAAGRAPAGAGDGTSGSPARVGAEGEGAGVSRCASFAGDDSSVRPPAARDSVGSAGRSARAPSGVSFLKANGGAAVAGAGAEGAAAGRGAGVGAADTAVLGAEAGRESASDLADGADRSAEADFATGAEERVDAGFAVAVDFRTEPDFAAGAALGTETGPSAGAGLGSSAAGCLSGLGKEYGASFGFSSDILRRSVKLNTTVAARASGGDQRRRKECCARAAARIAASICRLGSGQPPSL